MLLVKLDDLSKLATYVVNHLLLLYRTVLLLLQYVLLLLYLYKGKNE